MSGCPSGHQPRKRGCSWMSRVRYGSLVSSIAPSTPCCARQRPERRDQLVAHAGGEEARGSRPRRPGGRARRTARRRARARCRRAAAGPPRPSSAATASTASLTAFSVGLSDSAIDRTITPAGPFLCRAEGHGRRRQIAKASWSTAAARRPACAVPERDLLRRLRLREQRRDLGDRLRPRAQQRVRAQAPRSPGARSSRAA